MMSTALFPLIDPFLVLFLVSGYEFKYRNKGKITLIDIVLNSHHSFVKWLQLQYIILQ